MFEWTHSCYQETALYRLSIRTGGMVALEDGNSHQLVGIPGRVHELYRLGGWMIESVRGADGVYTVQLWCRLPGRPLELSFEGGQADELTASLHPAPEGAPHSSGTFGQISGVTIEPNRLLRIDCGQTLTAPMLDPPSPPEGDRMADPPQPEETARALEALNAELTAERQFSAWLQEVLGKSLEDQAAALTADRERLLAALRQKMQETETAEADRQKARREVEAADTRLASLRSEIESSESQLELRELDCEQAGDELRELRARLQSDADALTLMQEEPFLKGNSVRKTIDAIRQELEAAEARLGRIIAFREATNDAVQQVILRGDGTLPADMELGGILDGGSRAAAEDSDAGGAAPQAEPGAGGTAAQDRVAVPESDQGT